MIFIEPPKRGGIEVDMDTGVQNNSGDLPEKKKRMTAGEIFRTVRTYIGRIIVYYWLIPAAGCAASLVVFGGALGFAVVPAVAALIYRALGKKPASDMRSAAALNLIFTVSVSVTSAVLIAASHGDTTGIVRDLSSVALFHFKIGNTVSGILFENYIELFIIITAALTFFAAFAVSHSYTSKKIPKRIVAVCAAVSAAAIVVSCLTYAFFRPEIRYAGHGFDYMHGYSSTDFTDYTVYAENSKLIVPDGVAPFIENESEMPVMDGAEACYPLYAAFAKTAYKDIDKIELANKRDLRYSIVNGKIVSFTNTVEGFWRLLDGEVDLFFGARPSRDQLTDASSMGIKPIITPIGREAFVFFVGEDEPVDGLTSEQIKAIYHGDITNWKELGGKDREIVAFQRPENSGSQTMMQYFMGDLTLKEPMTYETVGPMFGAIKEVAQYANEKGAIGYSFRYFVEELAQEKGVKLLSVDGIAPTLENIENGSYPLTVDLCLITRKDDPNPNVALMRDFILSDVGQKIVRDTGYAPLSDNK